MASSRVIAAAVLFAFGGIAAAEPLGTAFTYQGELRDGDAPANGTYDLRFRLYTDAAGFTQVGATICADNVQVVDGRFTTPLDFGAVFDGQARYVEVDVRGDSGLGCANPAGFGTLSPRQRISAAPNAAFATSAATATTAASATTSTTATNATALNNQPATFYSNAGNLTGTLSDARLSTNVTTLSGLQTFTGPKTFGAAPLFSAAGAPFQVSSTTKVTSLNADLLDGLDSSGFSLASHTHDASGIVSGVLDDARLSSNIPRLNAINTFAGSTRFNAFVGINRGAPITSAELFGLQNAAGTTGYVGMYISSSDAATGKPFYGYSVNNQTAWTYLDVAGNWRLDNQGTRMTVNRSTGNLGLGVDLPQARLDMAGTDTAIRVRNSNDIGGGFVQNTYSTLQLGLFNPGASQWGAVPANSTRSMLGMENTGRVGTLTNTSGQPQWRNTIDDGAGNASFAGNVAANNMPAIKFVSNSATGSFQGNSVTLIESVPVTSPASGYLRITARCRVYIQAYTVYNSTATLELKETTSGEVTVKAVPLGIADGTPSASGANHYGDVTLEWFTPTTAGTRTFKLRLLHTQGGGSDNVGYEGSEMTVMYFPQGL